MDYSKLASELTGSEMDIVLSKMQTLYLKAAVANLPEDEQAMLEEDSDDNPSIQRAMVIRELRNDELLMAILCLGKMPVYSLLDALTCFVSGEFDYSINVDKNDPGSAQLEFIPIEDEDIDDNVQDFLNAKIAKGQPKLDENSYAVTGEERYLDKDSKAIDSIYARILAEKNENPSEAVWLQLKPEEIKIFSTNSSPTNNELLQYLLSQTEAESRKLFGESRFESIIYYFTYWLGQHFDIYVDNSDF